MPNYLFILPELSIMIDLKLIKYFIVLILIILLIDNFLPALMQRFLKWMRWLFLLWIYYDLDRWVRL